LRSLASVVIVLVLFAIGCSSDTRSETSTPAPGPTRTPTVRPAQAAGPLALVIPEAPDDGRAHLPAGVPHSGYSTTPATSGPHWSTAPVNGAPHGAPARWGIYTVVLPDEVLVHNLEHGGIGLHYNCPAGCPEVVSALTALVPPGASQFIASPYPGAPAKVVATAWRRLLLLDAVDSERIKQFIAAYQDKAPESIKVDLF